MKSSQIISRFVFAGFLLGSILFLTESTALASHGHHGHHGWKSKFHDYWHKKHHHPYSAYRKVSFNGLSYYYRKGHFYWQTPFGYKLIAAPLGIIIRELPHGCTSSHYHGKKYYHFHDTTFIKTRRGYKVVEHPQAYYPSRKTITVTLSNRHGGTQQITLTKSRDGYTAPDGQCFSKDLTLKELEYELVS